MGLKLKIPKWLRTLAGQIDRAQWLILLISAPFFLFPGSLKNLVLLVVPLLWINALLAGRNPLPNTPINLPIFVMAVMLLVSVWATYDLQLSLPKIAGVILGLGTFFYMVRLGRHHWGWIIGLISFLSLGAAVAAIGLFGSNWPLKFVPFKALLDQIAPLVRGMPGAENGIQPNEVAGALLWVVPLFGCLLLGFLIKPYRWLEVMQTGFVTLKKGGDQKNSPRLGGYIALIALLIVALLAGLIVTTGVLVLTQSRSAYLGLALVLPALFFAALSPRWRWGFAVVCLVAGYIIIQQGNFFLELQTVTDVMGRESTSLSTLNMRVDIWERALYALQDFPLTGMGMNTFRRILNVLYPFVSTSTIDFGHAHNEILQAGLDLGIPGMIAFISLYLGTAWMLWQTWAKAVSLESSFVIRCLVLGMAGGLLAHFLFGLTDAVALGAKPGLLFWILLGLVASLFGQVSRTAAARAIGN